MFGGGRGRKKRGVKREGWLSLMIDDSRGFLVYFARQALKGRLGLWPISGHQCRLEECQSQSNAGSLEGGTSQSCCLTAGKQMFVEFIRNSGVWCFLHCYTLPYMCICETEICKVLCLFPFAKKKFIYPWNDFGNGRISSAIIRWEFW